MAERSSNLIRKAEPVRKQPTDFSFVGVIYTCLMLFMGLAAIHSQANLLFAVFGILIGVLVVSWVVSRIVLRKLEIRRILPETFTVGQQSTVQYEFENRKRFWPSFSATLFEISAAEAFSRQPLAYLLHVAAGQRAMVSAQVIPVHRGLYHLDRFQVATSFPFGFIRRASDRRLSDGVLALPAMGTVDRRLLTMCVSAESSGARMKPRRGGTDEFYGVKEFRRGENPRFIYWKRSARTGTLVSKELTHVSPPRLQIFLDTCLPAGRRTLAGHAAVERAIAMAASLIACTIDEGLAVGLQAWSAGPLTIQPSRGKRHARDLLAVLARLPLNTQFDCSRLIGSAAHLLRRDVTGVLITPWSDAAPAGVPSRTTWVVIGSDSAQGRRWFTFSPETDFEAAIPLDQLTSLEQAI
ncbi:MAG: DUF58 domain-containing protein [Tepidisphaeraceae bacterium]|jgi:uncharacterized protein (DUF58 family)